MKITNDKEFLLGSWINTASPVVAEIMSNCGFDFLVVDTEHSVADFQICQQIFQAIQAGNPKCLPFVRLPGNNYEVTKKYLDLGAMGVIAPLINNAEQAEYLVDSVKYPPLGTRGVGFGRSHGYGFSFDKYMKNANEETFVCVQIEHLDAIANLDDIFSVDGIDAMIIGPYDLSASMGMTGQFNNPEFIKVKNEILMKAKKHNLMPGIHVVQPEPENVINQIQAGFKFIAYSLDITVIGKFFREGVNQIKEMKK
ncbi:MAG: 2,4-dihydroxyhept-2-ene-1,7-dioic acid aldolase [Firmicutes bacterium]|nr:2,4-dihydroxyhept-2-ene-1,7-dioic acid aldolase [Bacillota bacterium]